MTLVRQNSCVEGRDAEAVLNASAPIRSASLAGRIVYTQWLNDRGGIEADLTVTRLSERQLPCRHGRRGCAA